MKSGENQSTMRTAAARALLLSTVAALTLALRSITDVNTAADGQSEDQVRKRNESVNVVRYGIANQTTAQK